MAQAAAAAERAQAELAARGIDVVAPDATVTTEEWLAGDEAGRE